jgi:hypothetical protein
MPKLLVLAFLYVKIEKILKLLIPVFLQIKLKKKMPKLLVLVFLQVKLKKNTETISSGILICKNFKKKCWNY